MLDGQVALAAEEFVDGGGGGGADVDAFPAEVAVVEWGVDEEGAGSEGAKEFGEVERDLFELAAVVGEAGHVADLAPAGAEVPDAFGPVVVVEVGIESATADDSGYTRIEHGGIYGVMAAEGVADGGEAAGVVDEVEGFEEVKPADVVPDGLHGAADVAELAKVGVVVGEVRVGGGEGDVATFGEFGGILSAGASAEADDDFVADFAIGGMEAEDGGGFAVSSQGILGDAEVGGGAAVGFGLVGDESADVVARVGFLNDFHFKGDAAVVSGEVAHDLLHAAEDFGAAELPLGGGCDGLDVAVGVAVLEEVVAVEAGRFGGNRVSGREGDSGKQ